MGRHSPSAPADAYPEQDRGRADLPASPLADQGILPEPRPPADAGAPSATPAPGGGTPVGWPEQLADRPFDRAAPDPVAQPSPSDPADALDDAPTAAFDVRQLVTRPAPPSPEDTLTCTTEPIETVGPARSAADEPAPAEDDQPARPPDPAAPGPPLGRSAERTPTEVEQAEEEHLAWLRHLPDETSQHPPTHDRGGPPPPRQRWTERLVVGLLAALVTFGATRWAGAAWSTAAWIGATVLVVVPTVAWVATLGHRPSAADADPTTRVGT